MLVVPAMIFRDGVQVFPVIGVAQNWGCFPIDVRMTLMPVFMGL